MIEKTVTMDIFWYNDVMEDSVFKKLTKKEYRKRAYAHKIMNEENDWYQMTNADMVLGNNTKGYSCRNMNAVKKMKKKMKKAARPSKVNCASVL